MSNIIVSRLRELHDIQKVPVKSIALAIGTNEAFIKKLLKEDRDPFRYHAKFKKFIASLYEHENNPMYVYMLARAANARTTRWHEKRKRVQKPLYKKPTRQQKEFIARPISTKLPAYTLNTVPNKFTGEPGVWKVSYTLPEKYEIKITLILIGVGLLIGLFAVSIIAR